MIRIPLNHPKAQVWQSRMARMPRWGWITVAVAVLVPIVLLLLSIVAMALLAGLAAVAVVMVLMVLRSFWLRLRAPRDDGRRNVRIIVRQVPREPFMD